MLRRYLAYRSGEMSRVYCLLESAAEGSPGHGPVHLLVRSAAEIGFRWDPGELAWDRPGLHLLSNLSGPIQHFRAATLGAWKNKVSAGLCARKGFRGGPLLDIDGTLQLLNSDHVREREKALLRGILVGGVWSGFLLGKVRGLCVPCRFCGRDDDDGHFWEIVLFHLQLRSVNILSFMILWRWTSLCALGVFFGMVGCLFSLVSMVVSFGFRSPEWRLLVDFDVEGASRRVAEEPDVWTGGSLVYDRMSDASCVQGLSALGQLEVGHWDDDVGEDAVVLACRGFCSVPVPLQTVQRAELWSVILALQARMV